MADRGRGEQMRWVWPRLRLLLREERAAVLALVGFGVPSGFIEAGVVALVAQTAVALSAGKTNVVAGAAGLRLDITIGESVLIAGGLAVLILVLDVITSLLPPRIVANTQARLRRELFSSFVHTSWEVQSRERNGHLQEIMTAQVSQTAELLLTVTRGIGAILSVLGLLASAFLLAPLAAAAMAVGGVSLFFVFRPLAGRARSFARGHAAASVDFAEAVNEAVNLGEEYHVFGVQQAQETIVDAKIESVRGPFFKAQAMLGLVSSAYSGTVVVLLVGGLAGLQWFEPEQLGSIGAVVLILLRSLGGAQQLQSAYTTVHNSAPYLERVVDAIDLYRDNVVVPGGEPLTDIQSFAFEGVAYAYDDQDPALREATFSVRAGEAIGIVGPSGAGKSTLVQILLRLRQPDQGRYLVNGRDASDFDFADWSRQIAFVPQEPKLLQGTVADNVRFHRDVDQAALEVAAELAHIRTEIEAWPGGWQRPIGQRADAVSGGQRQRLCLARALATNPRVLVLDEPTSALDPTSEALVQQSLEELRRRGVTLFVIAHRPATLAFVDQVIVVDEGRVIAAGPLAAIVAEGSAAANAVLRLTQQEAQQLVADGAQPLQAGVVATDGTA